MIYFLTKKKKEMRVKSILVLAPFSRKGTSTHFPKEVKQKDEIILRPLGLCFLTYATAAVCHGTERVNTWTR